MAALTLHLLGGIQARAESGRPIVFPTRKAGALLAYLAVGAGLTHSRDRLAALLWGERAEEQARNSLRQTLYALRRLLPPRPTVLIVRGEGVALNAASVTVDVATFEERVRKGTPRALEQAVELYRGDLLEGLVVKEALFEEWLTVERARVRGLMVQALSAVLAHHEKEGHADRAILIGGRLLAMDPLRESAHRTLMRLLARQGQHAAALRQFQTCVETLKTEVGVEPEPETRALFEQIVQMRRARMAPAARGASKTPAAPLIGRESEVPILQRALGEAERSRGSVLALLGEAGIGKTRLMSHLVEEARRRGGLVLVGRCHPSEQILPFGPWVDALRGALAEPTVIESLAAPWRRELARLFPDLGERPAERPAGGQEYLRLFEAAAHLVERVAALRPALLVLEDLQWADDMTLRLLSYLGRRASRWPLLLVGTAREEETGASGRVGQVLDELEREHAITRLRLVPLSRDHVTALTRALARSKAGRNEAARLEDDVWRVSEGNPFVAVETLRALEAGTAIRSRSGAPLGESVRQMTSDRLTRLGEHGRRLVTVAAVAGRDVDFAVLQRASGIGEDEATAALEELVNQGVMHAVADRFDFVHDRVRDVADGEVLPPRRQLLHAAVAKAIEEIHGGRLEPYYPALGTHWRGAERWAEAANYLRRAGDVALTRCAYREAVAWLRQALEALEHLSESRATLEQAIDIRLELRTAIYPFREPARLFQWVKEAADLAARLGDDRRLARATAYLTMYFRESGALTQAMESGRQALALARATKDFAVEVAATLYVAYTCHDLGRLEEAIDATSRLRSLLAGELVRQQFGLPGFPGVYGRQVAMYCYGDLGRFQEASVSAAEAIELAEAIGQPFTLVIIHAAVALVHLLKGDFDVALDSLARCEAVTHANPSLSDLVLLSDVVTVQLAHARAAIGRAEEARSLLAACADRMGALETPRRVLAGEAYLLAGDSWHAREIVRQAVDIARGRGERAYEALGLRVLGDATLARGELDEAGEHYLAAIRLSEALGLRPCLASCHLGLGLIAQRRQDHAAARARIIEAIGLFREMEMTWWLRRAEAAIA